MNTFKQKPQTRDQKIVIFEGPDNCGKTCIAQGLSLDLKVPYYKMPHEAANWKGGTFKEELRHGEMRQVELLKQMKSDVVIDRGHPSEWVYSQVFGRETDMEMLRKVDDEYARMGTYIVILLRHDYDIGLKDELVPQEKLQSLHDKYLEFSKWTSCDCVILYVDAFGNDLKRELDVLRPELKWGDVRMFTTMVTLDRKEEHRDVTRAADAILTVRDFDLKGYAR